METRRRSDERGNKNDWKKRETHRRRKFGEKQINEKQKEVKYCDLPKPLTKKKMHLTKPIFKTQNVCPRNNREIKLKQILMLVPEFMR